MKKLIIVLVVIAFVVGGVFTYLKLSNKSFGLQDTSNIITLVGTSDDATQLPPSYVKANSTTTDAVDDGGLINQLVFTEGFETVRATFSALGAFATNTVNVRLMGSFDNVNYFDVMYSTSTPNIMGNGTTTPTIFGYVTSFAPGVATTSWTYDYDVKGLKSVRFILKGEEDDDLDNNEWTKAWIQLVKIAETAR